MHPVLILSCSIIINPFLGLLPCRRIHIVMRCFLDHRSRHVFFVGHHLRNVLVGSAISCGANRMLRLLYGMILFAFCHQLEVIWYFLSWSCHCSIIVVLITVDRAIVGVFVLIVLLPVGIRAEKMTQAGFGYKYTFFRLSRTQHFTIEAYFSKTR